MRDFHLLTIAEVQSHIGEAVSAALAPRGFSLANPLQWIDSRAAPLRRVFEYWQLKGGVVAPRWGYSFDFVPHLSGGKIKWHRTEKSALLDVFVDGQSLGSNLYYMWGVAGLLEGLPEKVNSATKHAIDFWQTAETPAQVFDQVASIAGRPSSRMQVQLPMAAAICHAFAGREDQGRKELEYYIDHRRPHEETIPKLRKVFENALQEGFRNDA